MRTLDRNKKTFYYSLSNGSAEITEDGLKTGRYETTYAPFKRFKGNISPEKGNIVSKQYGLSCSYGRTIVTDDMNCPIQINSLLWIGVVPQIDNTVPMRTKTPHNYIVERISKSLNQITIQVKRVE